MKPVTPNVVFNHDLIRRFDVNGPRYTSYPTADRFVLTFDNKVFLKNLAARPHGDFARPLSLYVHVPFCNTICYYCACNKIITKDHSRSAKYLEYLGKEMRLVKAHLPGKQRVAQLHLGGGTPTFLSHDEMRQLMGMIRENFELQPGGEFSIEVDPRKVDFETVSLLAQLGFNRMSIGVQDFNGTVQKAVNRVQSLEETQVVLEAARAKGFESVSMDLIYGLPHQSVASFEQTLAQIVALSPDRLSVYSYAHLPTLFMPQRRIADAALPNAEVKLQILQLAIERLEAAGYVYIGMDHFAKPQDELTIAQKQGRLHRNFQGYSTHADCDMLSFGVSAISKVGACYAQNVKTLDEYYERLDRSELPVLRGIERTEDDMLRHAIIQALMCHFELSMAEFEGALVSDFETYFAQELSELKPMMEAGLLQIEGRRITVLPPGRLLIRGIAMVFDKYLRLNREQKRYSKVI